VCGGGILAARSMIWTKRLTIGFGIVMLIQASTGLLFSDQYRDEAWIEATWFGNDCVTLVVALPLLIFGASAGSRPPVRRLLLWLGLLGYGVYNYAFYLLGSALNAFFLLYVAAVVLASAALIGMLSALDVDRLASAFRHSTPVRLIGGALVFIGMGLGGVWIALWAAHVVGGRPTPIEPEAFKVVAALDLTMMVPALTVGGVLLWRRRPWGFAIAAIAAIQGALYLLVLSVNSVVAIRSGFTQWPGELPLWGTLLGVIAAAATGLLVHVQPDAADNQQ
jgi:hypothetical protein